MYTKLLAKQQKRLTALELEASNAIMSFIVLFEINNETTNEEKRNLKKMSEKNDRKTLGNLLTQIKGVVDFDHKSKDFIDYALKKRNYLMHEFYKRHNFAIHSEEGREEMILELHDISNALNLAHMHLSTISKLFEKLDKRTLMSIEDISKLIRDGKRIHF